MTANGRRLLWVCAGLSTFGIVACSTVWGFDDLTGSEADAASDEASADGSSADTGSPDAGFDAGSPDAGLDTGSPDAGPDAAPSLVMSCATSGDGRTNCGSGSESCCTSLPVTGGTYNRTYTNTGSGPTGEADPATVSDFRLDKYLVTVGRFRQFVTAWNNGSGWTPPQASGKHTHLNAGSGLAATGGGYESGWLTSDNSNIAPTNANLACDASFATWTPSSGGHEKLPINCVNWYEAAAFCIWDGGFLPSDAEWEYAAAGGSAEREYPWGPTAPGTNNQYAIYGCNYPSPGSCTGVANIAPVGTPTAGAGKYGQLDLAGNVWEWNLDWYAGYAACTNCTNATPSSNRVIRGDYFSNTASYLQPPLRYDSPPAYRYYGNGFRCARTP